MLFGIPRTRSRRGGRSGRQHVVLTLVLMPFPRRCSLLAWHGRARVDVGRAGGSGAVTACRRPAPVRESAMGKRSGEKLDLSSRNLEAIPSVPEAGTVSALNLSMNRIVDVMGLEAFLDVAFVDLGYNRISKFNLLVKKPRLTILYLNNNRISDASGVARLLSLTKIRLQQNCIENIAELPRSLTSLDVSGNRLRSVSFARQLGQLVWFSADNNDIEDVQPISLCCQLEDLQLGRNRIARAACLSSLTMLTCLSLSGNRIRKLQDLPTLPLLQELHIARNRLTDIKGIDEQFPGLLVLDVSENGLRDLAVAIAALGRLPDLYELGIAANPCCASLDRDALVERISSSVPTVRVVDRVFVSPQEPVRRDVGEDVGEPEDDDGNNDVDDDDEDVPFRQRPATISWSVASQQDVVGEMLSANDLLLKSSRHRVDAIVRSSRLLLGEALLAAGAPPEMLRDGRASTTPVDDARKGIWHDFSLRWSYRGHPVAGQEAAPDRR
ncbi:unnamed protein product (mitochondrion) [Plasmodiophora brassicae]|uniref:Protein phosphatase 1 regulatory subunit 7 n=1 Tax=Plasmodiophora brassicae TaxID=37360 RepID=A0A3P3XZC9_PLABS|nr:unnamed protein product [Plasmodiophora brassicae]